MIWGIFFRLQGFKPVAIQVRYPYSTLPEANMKLVKKPWFKLLVLLVLIVLIVVLLRMLKVDFSGITEEKFKQKVGSLGMWAPVIYIGVYLLRPLIFFPAGVLSASAGVIWGPVMGFLYLQIAANISSTIEFFVSRKFAREAAEKFLRGRIVNLDSKVEKHGFLTVLLVRLIPNVAWDIQNLSLGLTKVKFRDYFFATLIGIMPGSFAFVFFGSSLIKVLFNRHNIWLVVLAVAIFATLVLLQKHLKRKHFVI